MIEQTQLTTDESVSVEVDWLNFAPVGYLTLAVSGEILRADLAASAVLGEGGRSPRKKSFAQFVAPEDSDRWRLYLTRLQKHFEQRPIKLTLQRSNSERLRAQINALPPLHDETVASVRLSIIDITRQRESIERVREYALQMSALSRRLLKDQERQRRYISRELQDEVGQVLTGAMLALGLVKRAAIPAEDQESLAAAERLVQQAISQARNLGGGLRSPLLDIGVSSDVLALLLKEHGKRADMDVKFVQTGERIALPLALSEALYRIADEALDNVAQHSYANSVELHLDTRDGVLSLTVQDDGVGFDPDLDYTPQHVGIIDMRERTLLRGGIFSVETSNRGTTVRAVFQIATSAIAHALP